MGMLEELNPFMSDDFSNRDDKNAMSYTLLVLSLIANNKESLLENPAFKDLKDWINGKKIISGSQKEPNYRRLILSLLDAKTKGYPIGRSIEFAQSIMKIEDVVLKIDAFASNPSSRATFNMDAYLKTMCKIENEKVTGLKPEVLNGQLDEKTLSEIDEAFYGYAIVINSIKLDKNGTNNEISK